MPQDFSYEQHCQERHNELKAQALKLEIQAFQDGQGSELWEQARRVRHESLDYIKMRDTDEVRKGLLRICKRTGKVVLNKNSVYLYNFGCVSRDSLTDVEKVSEFVCEIC